MQRIVILFALLAACERDGASSSCWPDAVDPSCQLMLSCAVVDCPELLCGEGACACIAPGRPRFCSRGAVR